MDQGFQLVQLFLLYPVSKDTFFPVRLRGIWYYPQATVRDLHDHEKIMPSLFDDVDDPCPRIDGCMWVLVPCMITRLKILC